MPEQYRRCVRCIMDTTDPEITFDENGVCVHCHRYDSVVSSEGYLAARRPGALEELVALLKKEGRGAQYDCIIGVSGGVDSTYVAYLTKQLGLRALAVHLDNGWNSELAVSNVEKTLKILGIPLETEVLDWEEFKDLQLSFLRSSTPDSEIPTDHAILSVLYQVAARTGVRHVLSGHNVSMECGGVPAWSQGHGDWGYVKSVHKLFGTVPLRTFPHYGPFRLTYYSLVKKIRFISILNYAQYDKSTARKVLEDTLGWKYYGGKHYESIYTRFYQGYILPKKFGFNKKMLHLSALIWSGQLTREQALEELGKEDYPEQLQKTDRAYVIKKLGISEEEFNAIMSAPPKTFWDYPSYKRSFRGCKPLMSLYYWIRGR